MATKDGSEAAELEAAWQAERTSIEAAYADFFSSNGVDALLTPTHPIAPVRVDSGKWDGVEDDGAAYCEKGGFAPIMHWAPMARYVRKFNEIRAPSVAVPTPARHPPVEQRGGGATRLLEGLPAGVLIWGPPLADSRVLRLGMALEQEFLLGAEDEVR